MKLVVVIILICFAGIDVFAQSSHNVSSLEVHNFRNRQKALKKLSLASDNYTIHYYNCYWKVDPAIRYIDGSVTAYVIATKPANTLVFDLSSQLQVDSIKFRGNKITYLQNANQTLSINLPVTLNTGDKDSVAIFYQGIPSNAGFGAFNQTNHAGVPIIWTLSEPYGASDWWPCRNGVDDKADSIDIHVTTYFNYTVSSNGSLVSTVDGNAIRTFNFKHRYPIATYLVAIAVTNYAVLSSTVTMPSGVNMPFFNYVYPENLAQWQTSADQVLQSLKLLSTWMGGYPFEKEKYAQTQFSWGGGMEHQTNSFITSTDKYLMAHELAHQWFGDKITCGTWSHLWLNEGFAVYFGDVVFRDTDPSYYRSLLQTQRNNVLSQPGGTVWVDDTANLGRLFDGRLTYDKGGYLLRMLNLTLGEDKFMKAMYNYINDPRLAYGFAFTKDIQQHMEAVHGKSLQYFFDQWFYGQGYPTFNITWSQNANHWAKLRVHQTTSDPSVTLFKMPIPVTFVKGAQKITRVVFVDAQDDEVWADVGFEADDIIIDEDLQILSKNNTVTKVSNPLSAINSIKVYPNPVKDVLKIELTNPSLKQLKVKLVNSIGQKVYENVYLISGADEIIPVTMYQLSAGVYHLTLLDENGIILQQKILK